ncbi:hypothetical protein [uncultured Ruegeria sp.]|uniref:hypothetical protein n=1 Tax=uncultured Ruegeria sp. TaxID=259304 RepID=UPI00261C6844|nr:hypothetical protein [uncultured Ruegeria sp.]
MRRFYIHDPAGWYAFLEELRARSECPESRRGCSIWTGFRMSALGQSANQGMNHVFWNMLTFESDYQGSVWYDLSMAISELDVSLCGPRRPQ